MMVRRLMALAASGGLMAGALAGAALRPEMKMAPLRPWQGSGQAVNLHDFESSTALNSEIPVTAGLPQWAYNSPPPRHAVAAAVLEAQQPHLERVAFRDDDEATARAAAAFPPPPEDEARIEERIEPLASAPNDDPVAVVRGAGTDAGVPATADDPADFAG